MGVRKGKGAELEKKREEEQRVVYKMKKNFKQVNFFKKQNKNSKKKKYTSILSNIFVLRTNLRLMEQNVNICQTPE